jgi:hypothetical protein
MKKNNMQDCIYYKYYLKIKFFIFKNKVHLYKRLKKNINESENISQKLNT